MNPICILGGGPAGSAAAVAALAEGSAVSIIERSKFPRHKVCGEFISPEIAPILDRLGLTSHFEAARPARIRNLAIHLGRTEKRAALPEPAWGLSRFAFDHLLRSEAERRGAITAKTGAPTVIASGRGSRPGRDRLFGFKAHFEGPTDDAVELFFLRDAYVGLNTVEDGRTNVCGLAPESMLRDVGFDPDALLHSSASLRARTTPLTRAMKWMFTGPLEFRQRWTMSDAYAAGDALSFIDPFTGSGLLCAVLTGSLAGQNAARRVPVADHLRACRSAIGRPFFFSSALRRLAGTEWAERLAPFVSATVLYRLTRPAR